MLREMAARIAEWSFVPIIEPVKSNFPALKRALQKMMEHNCRFILIANPQVGDLKSNTESLWGQIFDDQLNDYQNFSVGISLTATDSIETARAFFDRCRLPMAIIHHGFSDGKSLSELIDESTATITDHVFVEQHSSRLYRKHFQGSTRVIVEDGFNSRNNRDYPPSEPFSELYLVFQDELGCSGFGDFLMVGSHFREGGGPAYAVTLHLTFLDPAADNAIGIKHYVSDQIDTPKDPAGKYAEALEKLVQDVRAPNSPILRTSAVEEFLDFHREGHFPGLGFAKKLSMQHHVELMGTLLTTIQ